jgi:anaerobic magnesium-protoporphyrin IX monomethyl ester cyclase
MLSILVCHSYFLRLDEKQWARAKPYPPLATLQVAALLRAQGHEVKFFDAMLADDVAEYRRLLACARPQVVVIYEDTFNFLSKMCLAAMRSAALEMIGCAAGQGARVIVGGPDVSDAPAVYLRAGAEVALSGEGIAALLRVVARLNAQIDLPTDVLVEGIGGVVACLSTSMTAVPGAQLLGTARPEVPTAWDLVDMDRYRDRWNAAHGYFSLNMAASRGCSFRCAWCAKPTWGNHYLQRDARDVAHELAILKRTFAPDHIWFADDIFGFRVDWITAFAAAVADEDAKLPFTIQTRADLLSVNMAVALQDAGCTEAWLGAESGSQKVLNAMNKGTTVLEIVTARDRLKAVGIRVGFFIQLGYLDEQWSDIQATRELLRLTRPDDIGVSVSYPLPGTKFHEVVKNQLGSKTRWRESNDLDVMFRATYTAEFYRTIRNLMHEQVAARDDESKHNLEQRWQELSNHEARFRSSFSTSTIN